MSNVQEVTYKKWNMTCDIFFGKKFLILKFYILWGICATISTLPEIQCLPYADMEFVTNFTRIWFQNIFLTKKTR